MKKQLLSIILTLTMTASILSGAVLNVSASSDQHFNTGDIVLLGNYWQNDTNGDGVANQNDAKEDFFFNFFFNTCIYYIIFKLFS